MELKKGDLFLLGENRLMYGDSLSLIDVQKLMNKKVANMIFMDPPYSVNYVPETRRKGGRKVNELGGIIGDINFELTKLIELIDTGLCDGAVYMCCGTNQIGEIYKWAHKRFKRRPTIIIWVKNGYSILARDYHSAYECMFYFYYEKKKFRGKRNQSDVWFVKRRNTSEYIHPTQKPVRLVMKAIENSTDKGDIVLDLFGGSGTTLIASQKAGRKCYMMELDPVYVEKIIRRWEELTGQKAKKI